MLASQLLWEPPSYGVTLLY